MSVEHNTRALESDIVTDLRAEMSYSSYLQIETLLSAQVPVSSPSIPTSCCSSFSTRRPSSG